MHCCICEDKLVTETYCPYCASLLKDVIAEYRRIVSIVLKQRGLTMERKFKVRSEDVWDEEINPVLTGVIVRFEPFKVDKEERLTMLIDTGKALVRIWHSHALSEAFEVGKSGDGIRLEYQKTVPLKGGKTYKRISVQVWEGGDLEEIKKEWPTDTRPISD